jgi:hypothetical protein
MENKMTKLESLEPEMRIKVQLVRAEFEQETGYAAGIISARRTIKEQNELYKEAHDGDGIQDGVTNAKGGQSAHNFGYAVDLCPMLTPRQPWWQAPEELWQRLGEIAIKHGLTWGGNFKSIEDKPHLEDKKWKEAQLLWKQGKLEVA